MKSKIITTFITVIIFAAFIQVIVAPDSDEKIDEELLNLMTEKKYIEMAYNVFVTAIRSKTNAKNKVAAYGELPAKMKTMLDNLAENPWNVRKSLAPLFKEADKKLAKSSMAYRVLVKPVWYVVKGVANLLARAAGISMMGAGEMLKILAEGTEQSIIGANGETHDAKTQKTLDDFQAAGEAVRKTGKKFDGKGKRGLEKMRAKRAGGSESSADASVTKQGGSPHGQYASGNWQGVPPVNEYTPPSPQHYPPHQQHIPPQQDQTPPHHQDDTPSLH